MNEHSYSDEELVTLYKTGDNPRMAFNYLVKKYQEKIYWQIRRMVVDHEDANDLVQEVFIKIWKSLSSFNEQSKLYTWMFRIAHNETITFLNRKNKRFLLSFSKLENHLSEKIEADAYFSADETKKKLQKAILTLPRKQRMVFNLKYFDELPYEEISSILNTSTGALKASYHHAVKKIEKYLTGN